MNSSGHILIFDSGLGGTTILHELRQLLPHCQYSYAMDNAAFPYGEKTDSYLLARFALLFDSLIRQSQPDLVVVACNTASTLFLGQLRQLFPDLAFVGVVPAIKPAAQLSKTGVIALMATPATVQRQYIDALKEAHAANCQLLRFSHANLAILAEKKMRGEQVPQTAFDAIVAQFKQDKDADKVDTIVLGCTHYPAVQQELAKAWQTPITWVDSGAAIARRCKVLLEQKPIANTTANASVLLTSPSNKEAIMARLRCFSIDNCQIINLESTQPDLNKAQPDQ